MSMQVVEYLREQMIDRQQQREQRARTGGYTAILSTDSIGGLNKNLVLNYIRQEGPLSQAEIANRLRLSRGAVSDIVGFFKEKGFLEEGKQQSSASKGGKPATEIRFKADAAYIIGIDIGRSHLTIMLRDLHAHGPDGSSPWMISGEAIQDDSWLLTEGFETADGAESCLPKIVDKLHNLVTVNNLKWEDILGIGVGLPGTLDRNRERLTRAMMMPNWNDRNIPVMLRHLLRLPSPSPIPVYLDNDANLGVLGECRYGAGRKRRRSNTLYVKAGMGVGAGLMLGGEVFRGHGGSAGEFGHQIVDPNGLECAGCGHRGCLETFVAQHAIIQRAGLAEDASISDVVHHAQQGNKLCQSALQQAGELMGVAITNFIDVINPELILLDGSVIRDAGELIMEPLRTSADSCVPAAKGNADIRRGDLGSYAIAYGAIASVIDEAFPAEGY